MGEAYGRRTALLCRTAALLPAVLFAANVHAQAADPMHTRECVAAQQALAQAQEDAAAKLEGAKDKLAAARKHAQLVCLGRDSGNGQRVGAPEPAIVVPPPEIEPPPPRPAAVATPPAPPPPPVTISRPAAITMCDPGGCWDSEGRRLNQVGPMLLGPRGGVCTVQGGVVLCP
jgi:hypothetical protein